MVQVDLFENMEINKIKLDGKHKLKFEREFNAVFIEMSGILPKGSFHQIKIEYEGNPVAAKRPPWDGGFIWSKDSVGNPWVAVTVQGTGASLWWPNKDHQSDEPDSMMISISVPHGLENISNGRLRRIEKQKNGWMKYNWFVSYPINNYNVTVNIGKFTHFNDMYIGPNHDTLTLDYYVLPQELEKAKRQFAQVKPMMDFFYDDENPGAQNLVIKDSSKIVIIPAAKITYIEAFDYYIKIHYEGQFKLTRIPIKNIIPRLPKDQFIRVHRSYVINMNHIDQLEKRGKGETVAILRSGQEIRVSDTYKKELLKRIQAPEN